MSTVTFNIEITKTKINISPKIYKNINEIGWAMDRCISVKQTRHIDLQA